jgi:hypothetical protein
MGCKNCKNSGFREMTETKKNALKKGINMVQSYASALASRGFGNKKVEKATKQLRVISCFGNQHVDGILPPCQHLKESKTLGKNFCGGCGCGDRPQTWLVAEGGSYGKLDHPKLSCPLGMPGFTDYKPSEPDEAEEPITRKYYIENMDYEEIQKIPVTIQVKQ